MGEGLLCLRCRGEVNSNLLASIDIAPSAGDIYLLATELQSTYEEWQPCI